MDDADDLRDDVAGFPHLNGIADAEAELADEILVVEGRAGHRPSREKLDLTFNMHTLVSNLSCARLTSRHLQMLHTA